MSLLVIYCWLKHVPVLESKAIAPKTFAKEVQPKARCKKWRGGWERARESLSQSASAVLLVVCSGQDKSFVRECDACKCKATVLGVPMRELLPPPPDEEPSERLAGLMARRRRSARVVKNKRKHVTCITLNNNLICAENANNNMRYSVCAKKAFLSNN
jgi:hypothetical protein